MDTVVPDSLSPWKAVPPYIARRIDGAPIIDGRLDESCWRSATRSPRFADLVHATPGQYDTRAAVLWDDECLYVGYWVEEPHVEARHTRRDALIYEDNDVELFIAGPDATMNSRSTRSARFTKCSSFGMTLTNAPEFRTCPNLPATHPARGHSMVSIFAIRAAGALAFGTGIFRACAGP